MVVLKEIIGRMENQVRLNQSDTARRVLLIPARLQLDDSTYLFFILIAGGLLRFLTLGRQSLWVDEGLSYWIANQSWADLLVDLQTSVRPLHFVILHFMILLGGSEWMLRAPSAIAGVISLVLFYALVAEFFDRKTGLLAALLLAISPFHVWYSQEARMYAIECMFMLAASLFAVRGLRKNRWWDWCLFGLFEGLTLLSETGGIWFVLSFNFAAGLIFFFKRQTGKFWSWVFSQAIAFIEYLPILINVPGAMKSGDTDWIPPATIAGLFRLVVDFVGGHYHSVLQGIAVLAVLLILFSAAASRLVDDYQMHPNRYIILVSWLVLPVGISFLISQEYFKVPLRDLFFAPGVYIFLNRNLITVMFPLYILIARGLILTRREIGILVLTSIISLSFIAYIQNNLKTTKENFRAAASLVSRREMEGDTIVLAPDILEAPFAYYYNDRALMRGKPAGIFRDGLIDASRNDRQISLQNALEHSHRVWLITSRNIYQGDRKGISKEVEAIGEKLDEVHFQEVQVDLFLMEP